MVKKIQYLIKSSFARDVFLSHAGKKNQPLQETAPL
jgi:hypothetical protein